MNHGLKRSVIAAGLALSCTIGFGKAQAAVITWNGATSTVWATGTNWTPTGPPTTTSGVIINPAVHEPTIPAATAVFLNGTGGSLTVNSGAVLTLASGGGSLSMNGGNHPITLMNGGSIIDSGALFANVINLNGGSIGSGPLGSAGGIQVNPLAHFSASTISGYGSVDGSFGGINGLVLSGGIMAKGGTMTLTGGVAPNSMTVFKTGTVDLEQDVNLASLFGDTTSTCFPSCINYGTLDLNGFNLQVGGVPVPAGFYINPTVQSVVDIINVPVALGVPEPRTWVLLTIGFAFLGYAAFRTSNKNVAATV